MTLLTSVCFACWAIAPGDQAREMPLRIGPRERLVPRRGVLRSLAGSGLPACYRSYRKKQRARQSAGPCCFWLGGPGWLRAVGASVPTGPALSALLSHLPQKRGPASWRALLFLAWGGLGWLRAGGASVPTGPALTGRDPSPAPQMPRPASWRASLMCGWGTRIRT